MDSPKTPTQATFDDSYDDYDSEEMESPKFPHLIPIYHRRDADYDLKDVRIGWDDGYGSVFFDDDDYDTYRNGKRRRRSRNGRFFTDHHHRSMHRRNQFCDNSPSPINNSPVNNAAIQAELNDYLGCILNCLSAKKRDRQLLKAKKEASSSTNNSTEINNVKSLLDDSADDELMLLCTQDVERTIANDDANCKNMKETKKHVKKLDYLSIVGISPLKDTNDNTNNNEYYHVSKKFKPIYGKKNENSKSPCHTITSNMDKNEQNNKAKNHDKDYSVSLFNDSIANEDELFSSIDLSEIEQQISSDNKTISASVTQKCNIQQHNTHIRKQYENKPACTSTITSNSSSVLWRRSTSSSSVNKQSQLQDKKSFCDVPGTQINPSGCTITTGTRYCTPAEIEEKRNRARRTLLLKFKSKNKTIS